MEKSEKSVVARIFLNLTSGSFRNVLNKAFATRGSDRASGPSSTFPDFADRFSFHNSQTFAQPGESDHA